MTNAEKYLKDGVVAEELWKTFRVYYYKNKNKESDVEKAFRSFFEQKAKPTLTEDERVILRNIDSKYEFIGRDDENFLYVRLSADNGKIVERLFGLDSAFPSLFKFIKNGEEYEIAELLKG